MCEGKCDDGPNASCDMLTLRDTAEGGETNDAADWTSPDRDDRGREEVDFWMPACGCMERNGDVVVVGPLGVLRPDSGEVLR